MQANTIIIANGTPVIMTDVWSAVKPPANISTAATTPSKIAQVTLDTRGELSLILVWLLDESIEATNDPESEEVTKKVIINIKDKIESCWDPGYMSYKLKRAIAKLPDTTSSILLELLIIW